MKLTNISILILLAGLLGACTKNTPATAPPVDTTKTVPPIPTPTDSLAIWGTIIDDTNTFYQGVMVGKITDQTMSSISGIGASRYYAGMFWVENDQGGGTNDIFLVDSTGAKRAVFSVTGSTDRDWTDMSVGPGPDSSLAYIYLAEIGDSKADHPNSIIYRFPEPQAPLGPTVLSGNTATAEKITFVYPNGPRDAETILLDPQSKDIFIVDKNSTANLYYLPYPQSTDTVIAAKWVLANMRIGPLRSGAIASNRKEIFIKTYTQVFYWKIAPGESILDALLSTPIIEPFNNLLEVQGEAMCLTPDDQAYWTTSKFSTLTYANLDCYRRK